MNLGIKDKLLTAQAIDNFKKPEFDSFEKAELINELIIARRSACPKCKSKVAKYGATSPKGGKDHWCEKCSKVVDELSKELGVPRKTLYEIRKLIDVSDYTKDAIKDKKISPQKACRIVSNLKDEFDSEKEIEIVNQSIHEELNTREIEDLVAETNNPKIKINHGLQNLSKAIKHLKIAKNKLSKKDMKNVKVKDCLNICEELIAKIKKK